jgi:hypothetical protein
MYTQLGYQLRLQFWVKLVQFTFGNIFRVQSSIALGHFGANVWLKRLSLLVHLGYSQQGCLLAWIKSAQQGRHVTYKLPSGIPV